MYTYYQELLQPSDVIINEELNQSIELDNFRESLDKENGYWFNKLINIFNENNIKYKVIDGFDYKSDDVKINTFKKIVFQIFEKFDIIENFINLYNLKDIFNINIDVMNNIYEFKIKE